MDHNPISEIPLWFLPLIDFEVQLKFLFKCKSPLLKGQGIFWQETLIKRANGSGISNTRGMKCSIYAVKTSLPYEPYVFVQDIGTRLDTV